MASYVAIVGPGDGADDADRADAYAAGRRLAEHGVTVVTGGLGGVMAAAAAGAGSVGGTSVGLLPGDDRAAGDPAHSLLLPTGVGEVRNALVVRAADVVLAIGGSWGTLSEVALACRSGTPVVAVRGWQVEAAPVATAGPEDVDDIDVAVERVLELLALDRSP